MDRAVLDLLERLEGSVSFIELCQHVEGFAGEQDCALNEHLVLWEGVSNAGIETLSRLHMYRQIAFVACNPLVYLLDGQMLRLPIAKRRQHLYKRPHWYPVTLSTPAQLAAHTAPRHASRRTRRTLDHAPRRT